jgi:hypothetical protein
MHSILYLKYYKWYQSTFLGRKMRVKFFFRVQMYSDILKLHRSLITRINPQSGSHTRSKYKWYLSTHMFATLVICVGTHSSGITLERTCIWIDLYLLKPSIDKPINHSTAIVPPRKSLGNILSSI